MTKLIARLPDADLEHVLAVAAELAGDDASTTLAGSSFVEMAAAGVGKEAALALLAAERGLDADRVVAFGDHLTDAAMVAWAGHGVAVANAHPAVLAVADEVCASNDDDGVAEVLERIVAPRRGRLVGEEGVGRRVVVGEDGHVVEAHGPRPAVGDRLVERRHFPRLRSRRGGRRCGRARSSELAASLTAVGEAEARTMLAGPKRIAAASNGSSRGPGSQSTIHVSTVWSITGTSATSTAPRVSSEMRRYGLGSRSATIPPAQ